jgi:hypothetical protein
VPKRREFDYRRVVPLICGHSGQEWPQITRDGKSYAACDHEDCDDWREVTGEPAETIADILWNHDKPSKPRKDKQIPGQMSLDEPLF